MVRRRGVIGILASGSAACLTVVVFCAVAALRHTVPFGPGSRNVDDMGNQYMPFHAVFRSVLTGQGPSDL